MENKRIIRRRNGFADRSGIAPLSKEMQFDNLSKESRVILKNFSFKIIDIYKSYFGFTKGRETISELFANGLFCIETRGDDSEYNHIEKLLNQVFDEGEYDEVLDTIEFISQNLYIKNPEYDQYYGYNQPKYINLFNEYNEVFEKEYIGYRFINKLIVKITNKKEIESIQEASNSKFNAINEHLNKAILFVSESKSKDYKNSIKESISAVEALCSIITKSEKGTLGEMINIISKEKQLHPALKDSISKLYGFTSDEPGIRHGKGKKGDDISFDDAKFVLVVCSAIINYFISSFLASKNN